MLVRTVGIGVVIGACLTIPACGDSGPATADAAATSACVLRETFQFSARRKIDLLFVIDDSPAMAGMEAKLARELPTFMAALVDPSTNQVDNLHIAVVSTSVGGGRFSDVPGCEAGGTGDRGGRFSHPGGAGLAAGETFMRMNGVALNFQDDAGAVFSRLAEFGHSGCPYPQPLEAARRALTRARNSSDPDNGGGFLRDDAILSVVFISNEDDCSVLASSDLFDPGQTSVSDRYGAPGPYRCAEFGWVCDGAPPPHQLPSGANQVAFDMCVPAEAAGKLTPVAEFRNFLTGLKANPDDVLVSVVTGPTHPVVLGTSTDGASPALVPSCTTAISGETSTPGVRLAALANAFGPNGVLYPTCADDWDRVLIATASKIQMKFGGACVVASPVLTPAGVPNCRVTQVNRDENDVVTRWGLSACDADRSVLPCWAVDAPSPVCSQGVMFRVCSDETCTAPPSGGSGGNVTYDISCQVACQ